MEITMTTVAQNRPARRGRPAGTRNQDTPKSTALPAPCPSCASTDHEVLKKLEDQVYCGTHQDRRFTSIERRRCRCTACGQHFMRVDYPFDPEAWNEPVNE